MTAQPLAIAIAALRAGRGAEAEAACRRALAQRSGDPSALHLLGLALKAQGRLGPAIEALEDAVGRAPGYAEALYNLGNTLGQVGRAADAADRYRQVVALRPDHEAARVKLGDALREAGELPAAETAYRAALDRRPKAPGAWLGLGNVLQEQNRLDEAVAAYRAALAAEPGNRATEANLAAAELKRGRPAEAIAAIDAILAVDARDVRAVAYRTVALEMLGQGDEARRLADPERFVALTEAPVPPGYADRSSFHQALLAEVRAHRTYTATWDPRRRAARGGWLATELFIDPPPALAALNRAIRAMIDALVAALPDDPTHPYLGARPMAYTLDAWCNILLAEGHQAGHIHNQGWLSGVYYVAVPAGVGADDPAGWIEFGRPGYGLPEPATMSLRTARPRPGLTAMFPSYMWHRTIPFAGAGERVSIAFDLHRNG
ncbi:MAG: tetratricopeptide repeat protein [Alphaproteobacteria bacterium]